MSDLSPTCRSLLVPPDRAPRRVARAITTAVSIVIALAGCGATGPAPATNPAMRTLITTEQGRIQSTTTDAARSTVEAPVARVFATLGPVLEETGFATPALDAQRLRAFHPGIQRTGRLGKIPLSSYVECGSDMTGLRANRDRVVLSITITAVAAGAERTELQTLLTATSRSMAGSSTAPVDCGSTGRLEQELANAVKLKLLAPK